MIYRQLGKTGIRVSVLGMGGHEYLPNGKSRGFNENRDLAATPGYLFDGFVNENRKRLLEVALDAGINFFDVTMDSEKDAFGKLMAQIRPTQEIYLQTRPEGMLYDYDPNNTKMAQYPLLRAEVERILRLVGREAIDFLNLAPLQCAWKNDPDYMEKLADAVRRIKADGLIRFACADTFSGEETYLKLIETGVFDVVYINFNFGDDKGLDKVFPAAQQRGMGIIGREAYMKGQLFRAIAPEMGLEDTRVLASAALKWCYQSDAFTLMVYGTGKERNLRSAIETVENGFVLTDEETSLLERARQTRAYREFCDGKDRQFAGLVK